MELKEGMYVRTEEGYISKVCEIIAGRYFLQDLPEAYTKKRILKASHNPIDLIEVGDYVNGHKVYDDFRINKDDYGVNFIEIGVENDKFLNYYIREDEIKSIVTKEQFSKMEYKVGE